MYSMVTIFNLYYDDSLVAQKVKNLPAMWENQVQSLHWEDSLEKEWQPTPVFLPGESPRIEESGGLQLIRSSQTVRHDWVTNTFTFMYLKLLRE